MEFQCFEIQIKTEADSNDITQHDDVPSTGMIVLHYECILCTSDILLLKIINTLMLIKFSRLNFTCRYNF